MSVIISFPGSDTEDPQEYPFECVSKAEVEPYLGSGKILQWRFDRRAGALIGEGVRKIADVGPCQGGSRPLSPFVWQGDFSLISTAIADPAINFADILDDLESDSTTVRREARSLLYQEGMKAIPPMLERLKERKDSYRVRLGVAVALTEYMREHKSERREIAKLIDDQSLEVLCQMAGDEDRTVRVFASEFLYDLGDPRAVKIALELIRTASENGKYNLILVIHGAYPDLKEADRAALALSFNGLRSDVGPRTQELIDKVLGSGS
ncbi:HEAT repeat domain-containing protein [Oleomonas cavernae]|uniref:HEAT repeat domain-containing protein n=1 Tax=Oleomonas cavernae TaxID=2320859 RepID=A0A418WID2_9PROT|nr:HEAT repeat domain-containing protein [Oleomonas cavernae]